MLTHGLVLSSQCLQASETCDSISLENIVALMFDTKTSTRPLFVLDGSNPPEITG